MHISKEDQAHGKTRLVIADDDEPTRYLLNTLLGLVPHVEVVGEAADGEEAVRLALRHRADVVLLDVNMPGMDGFKAAAVLTASLPRIRVILQTADDDGAKRQRAEALGLKLLMKGSFGDAIAALTI